MRQVAALLFALAACSPDGRPDDPSADGPVTPPADGDAPAPPGADGSTDPPPTDAASVEECASYPFRAETLYAERLGFGAGTTGGDWTNVYHVTTLADAGPGSLREALESAESYWIVFDVEGLIDLADDLHVLSNKTVDGRGRDITIDGNLKLDAGTRNVIFTDVALQFPEGWETSDGDLISIRGHGGEDPGAYDSQLFWFHHLDLGRGGDGQLDNRGGTFITISWCHMHSHAKSMLHTNDTDQNPSPGQRVTYHHNWLEKITRRGPQFHWGKADFFNNYHQEWYEYGAASQRQAELLSENNIYQARPGEFCFPGCPDPNSPTGDSDYEVSKVALTPEWDTEPGYVKSVGDLAQEGADLTEREPGLVFDRATFYLATPEPADEALKTRLTTETGPRKTYCR